MRYRKCQYILDAEKKIRQKIDARCAEGTNSWIFFIWIKWKQQRKERKKETSLSRLVIGIDVHKCTLHKKSTHGKICVEKSSLNSSFIISQHRSLYHRFSHLFFIYLACNKFGTNFLSFYFFFVPTETE